MAALPKAEAEYTAVAKPCKEPIWLKGMIIELRDKQETTAVYCDSQSPIHISKNQRHHEKTKYIHIKLHFVRLAAKLLKIYTKENLIDILTKAVPSAKFNLCMSLIGFYRFQKALNVEKESF